MQVDPIIKLFLKRKYYPEATVGRVETLDGQPIIETLERKNANNLKDDPKTQQNESSCIPEGTYVCKWTRSNRFSNLEKKRLGEKYSEDKDAVWLYELIDVKDRAGIRIHPANWVHELHGCIAPATRVLDLNPKQGNKNINDKRWYASQSRDAHKKLLNFTQNKNFTLILTNFNQCSN